MRYYEKRALSGRSTSPIAFLSKVGPVHATAGTMPALSSSAVAASGPTRSQFWIAGGLSAIVATLLVELTLIPGFAAILSAPRQREDHDEAQSGRLLSASPESPQRAVVGDSTATDCGLRSPGGEHPALGAHTIGRYTSFIAAIPSNIRKHCRRHPGATFSATSTLVFLVVRSRERAP